MDEQNAFEENFLLIPTYSALVCVMEQSGCMNWAPFR